MCDDVHIELEALEATYDGAVTVSPGLPVVATVSLAPRGCPLMMPTDPADASTEGGEESLAHAEARCFVRATLLLACDAAYPQHPPDIKLQQPRGPRQLRITHRNSASTAVQDCCVACCTSMDEHI